MKVQDVATSPPLSVGQAVHYLWGTVREDSASLRAELAEVTDLVNDVSALLDRQAARIYGLEKDLQTLIEEAIND